MAIGSTSSAADADSAGQEQPSPLGWGRWPMPSVGDLIFVAMLGLLAFTNLSERLLGDAGIGWHIRTGQLILATHAIPHVDPFSSTMAGHAWFAWEWLFDVIVGWLDSAAGLNGVVLFVALIIATVLAWTFGLLLRRGTNIFVALALVLLAAAAATIHFLARPHVLTWLLTVLWFWILESSFGFRRAASRKTWQLWLLPPLMLLWVNLHGGFLIGFALLGIYWFSAAWQWFRSPSERFEDALKKIRAARDVRTLTFVSLLSALATFVNPYGWNLHLHIYRYLTNRFLMDHIDEFQSPNFHLVAEKCFAGLLLMTLIGLAVKKRELTRDEPRQGLVILFAVYAGLYASRNLPIASLLLILVIGPWLSSWFLRLAERAGAMRPGRFSLFHFLRRMQAVECSLRGHLWPIAAVVLACGIAANGGRLGATPLMDAHFSEKRFPAKAVTYLQEKDIQGPVLAPDYWGGYLVYRLYPGWRMVIDDRHDFYGDEFLKSYLKMVHVEPGWGGFIRDHDVRCIIVPRDSALGSILAETAGWKDVYHDEVAIVFVRTS
ncbi:MAG TPA: hypothetical protein VNY51_12360 [Candidatus Dormibacteraeota bacterium]|jgi:hypothetical protein|nr:hypothetical protein [Candidatus Dormibacteraeota bacterium]